MVVQSVVFKRDNIELPDAIQWVKDHGYKAYKIDTTPTQFRFRQYSPELLAKKKKNGKPKYYTDVLDDKVSLIVAR
jgi:hypothetical protein